MGELFQLDQKTDHQKVTKGDYNLVIENMCNYSTTFFERPGGKEIENLIEKGIVSNLFVWQIERLSRNLQYIHHSNP